MPPFLCNRNRTRRHTAITEPEPPAPDAPVAAFTLPVTQNCRAAHTGVAEDVRKPLEPAVTPGLSGLLSIR